MSRRKDERVPVVQDSRVQVGLDRTTNDLLTALAKFDGSSKVHVIRQLVRSAARTHYGSLENALLEVRSA